MTIWILAVLLLASTAGMGYRQGAIRAAFSFAGIFLGACLAAPLAGLVRPLLSAVGLKHPVLLWLVPPLIVFVVILIAFKIAGHLTHQKVEVYYKYKAGDLRLALWSRLHHRLGLGVGLLNGTAYLVLVSFVIYAFSYWTVQVASGDSDPKIMRLLDRMGKDLDSTGMARVARSIDGMPASFYEAGDLVGMLYHTPLLEARLYRYPAFLGLSEQPEFQGLLNDAQLTESWQKQAPIMQLIEYPGVKAILKNSALLKNVWAAAEPNLQDLSAFLKTGESQKFASEKLLGRWDFDMNGAVALILRAKPNIPSAELAQTKKWMAVAFAKTTLVAMPDQQALLKNLPHVTPTAGGAASTEMQTLQGQWKGAGGKYVLTFNTGGGTEELSGEIRGDRLTLTGRGMGLAFEREE